jgi:glycosyltransferase involved in cell wall biosynthesis
MGAYANWFWGLNLAECADAPSRSTTRIDSAHTLLIADFEPRHESLTNHFLRPPRVMVLPAAPTSPLPGVSYFRFRTATNPIQWDSGVDDVIRAGIDTVAIFLPSREVRGQTLMRLRRLGVRRILLLHGGRLRRISPLRLALVKKLTTFGTKLLRELGLGSTGSMTEARCRTTLRRAAPRRMIPADTHPLRVAHFVTALNSGGAERQACYAAIGQQAQGHQVRVLTRLALVGADAHYLPLLAKHDITARFIASHWEARFLKAWSENGGPRMVKALAALPPELAGMVLDLLGELLANPVDVLHCYVDDCNIVGVIAGCLAGVPAIILSFRNGNPTHFPGLLRPWMLSWYRTVLDWPGVKLCANAEMGARDYEDWLGLPKGSVPIIRNAFAPPLLPDRESAMQWRRAHGIPVDVPLVAGVFRLQPEKRPLYFVECVNRLRSLVPNVRVVLAGVGELESAVSRRIDELKLENTLTLLGQRQDVPAILAASDALLLVSDWEGTPNILLEAQHCGCVPIATDAGGSREAMLPGKTGILVPLNALEETVQELAQLLRNADKRQQMAIAAQGFVNEHFAPDRLHAANMSIYRAALRSE